jgi:hypothetical protein
MPGGAAGISADLFVPNRPEGPTTDAPWGNNPLTCMDGVSAGGRPCRGRGYGLILSCSPCESRIEVGL